MQLFLLSHGFSDAPFCVLRCKGTDFLRYRQISITPFCILLVQYKQQPFRLNKHIKCHIMKHLRIQLSENRTIHITD